MKGTFPLFTSELTNNGPQAVISEIPKIHPELIK